MRPSSSRSASCGEQVARARAGLQRLGVGPGDRVVAYLPNIPETLVAFLATASLGAIWATCPPEFGVRSVLHRLGQLEPKLLLAVAGYRWGDKLVDRREQVAAIRDGLPSLEPVVHVPYAGGADDGSPTLRRGTSSWATRSRSSSSPCRSPTRSTCSSRRARPALPKAIVHGHGGILLEHLKNHGLSWDLRPGDRLQWFTTTAWMMWNALVSTLLLRASIVMIDGNPAYPDLSYQWRLAEDDAADDARRQPGVRAWPAARRGWSPAAASTSPRSARSAPPARRCRWRGSSGSTEQFGPDVLLNLGSGGTDVCTGIVQGYPLLPVYAGEMSGRCLGVDAAGVRP